MSYNRRMRRDDFDIESIEKFNDRDGNRSRPSGSRTRSRSRKRSYNRRSRSRSSSVDNRRHHHRRGRNSGSRSRSRSRGHDYSRRNDRNQRYVSSNKNRDSRSRSYSRSRSKSQTYSSFRHQSERNRYRDNEYDDKYRKRSRSRSRSSSHFRDFGTNVNKKQNQSPRKQSRNDSKMSNLCEEDSQESKYTYDNVEDFPLPEQNSTDKQNSDGIYRFAEDEPIDRERIHREMEEKLRAELAKEGKVYPPPKPEASHPVFANDGSFLEIFKKMQQAQATTSSTVGASTSAAVPKPILAATSTTVPAILATANPTTAPFLAAAATGKSAPPPPIVGRRRGGKILKTGVVAKPKVQTETTADPKDFWSLYLAEVNKYKNTACESEQGNRPLVK